jgi:hypothetical protein
MSNENTESEFKFASSLYLCFTRGKVKKIFSFYATPRATGKTLDGKIGKYARYGSVTEENVQQSDPYPQHNTLQGHYFI